MADAIIGDVQVGATKQDLIAARAQRELKQKAILAQYFTDVSQFAIKGAKSISFPKLSSFTAVDRPSGTAGDATVVTATVDDLNLDQKPYVAYIVDTNDEIQSTLNFQVELAGRAGSAHGRRFDNDILAELIAAATLITPTGAITYDIAVAMRELLLDNEGMMEDAAWIVSGDTESALVKIDEFKRQDIYGPNGVVKSGAIGTLFGAPVVRHNGLAADKYFLAGKEGLAYGFQRSPAMSTQPANEYGVGAERTAFDQLYGVKGLQIGEGKVPVVGKSALIIGDNN